MKYSRAVLIALALLITTVAFAQVKKEVPLTEDEEDKVREARDPSDRIQLYVEYAQARLARFEAYRSKPADPRYDVAGYLDRQLGQFIGLTDELKDWIQDQYDRNGDMRKGLHVLLETGPGELEQLRRIQQSPDANAAAYADSLRDAIDDLTDTLDGATKALADQEKKFAALKQDQKADAQAVKLRAKEEKKRDKEEKKLRKKERKSGAPADSDDN